MRTVKNINHIPYTVYKFCSNTEIIMKRFDVEPPPLSDLQCEEFYEKALLFGEKLVKRKEGRRSAPLHPSPAEGADIFILKTSTPLCNKYFGGKSFKRNIPIVIYM